MTYPTVDTSWATNTVAYPVLNKNGNSVLTLNKIEPTNQVKTNGGKPNIPVAGSAINYVLNAHHQAIQWLRQGEVGTILEFEDGTMTDVQLMADRGGTWVSLGTIVRGYSGTSTTVEGFKKTA